MENPPASAVTSWYEERYREEDRLSRHHLEFVRVQQIISRYLRADPMVIADIGGAGGTYSFWLAEMGHDVRLVDFTPRHLRLAEDRARSTGVHLGGYHCADARAVPLADQECDLVLEMGPLYHLQQTTDRLDALREARRLLRPGGTIICQVITRWASVLDGFVYGHVRDDYFWENTNRVVATGCYENPENRSQFFTSAYFHRPNEIRQELEEAGFLDIHLVGVEGFSSALPTGDYLADPIAGPRLLECLAATESIPELLGVSCHIAAIATKP